MTLENANTRPTRGILWVLVLGAAVLPITGCGKDDKKDVARGRRSKSRH